ncbi:MAG: TonB-dependent receptor, partial [Bryobacteraceae bacterium]
PDLVRVLALSLLLTSWACAQNESGELRIRVTDPGGLPIQGSIDLASEVNQVHRSFETGVDGRVTASRLPFGLYRIQAAHSGFATFSQTVEIRSAIPRQLNIVLAVAPVQTEVTVSGDATLIDPHRTGSVNRIGRAALDDRLAAQPGRSLADLVNTEPGWLLEANGVLHPRGEEYQSQYIFDGQPLTDNRSSAFVADLDANEVQEMSILTAGFPAEYGRKLGGVIEIQTERDKRPGFHGKAVLSGGSFDTAGGYLEGQEGWGLNTLTMSLSGALTDRYLDPPVTQNFTNHGTTADLTAHYERDLNDTNRIGLVLRRGQSKFLVPNEIVQQQAGQRQDRGSFESAAQFSYTHIFTPDIVGDVRAMERDITAGLWSNDLSTPMVVSQDRGYRESYVNGAVSIHHGRQEFKVGAEGDFASLRESLAYRITNPSQFDPATPWSFDFFGTAPDREQSGFAQDLIRLKNWTVSAGLRFDHYRLLTDQSAWSPRLGLAYYWPAADIVFRGSYDRVFQTPAFENLLIASSPQVASLSDQVLRLPVEPARGNYFEAGFAKALFGKLRLDANLYHRDYTNFPDDDLLLNTGVSFPIAFSRAVIYGAEVKLELPKWGRFSGFASYSNMRGNGFFPVAGGLFLGDQAAQAASAGAVVFPVSQDQRNTVRARLRYQVAPRLWVAFGGTYDSGLPVDFDGTLKDAEVQYGPDILRRVNFSDGRTRPAFTLNASVGATLRKADRGSIAFQADVVNLTNQLNVLDFAGLFSGTALAEPRSANARLTFEF